MAEIDYSKLFTPGDGGTEAESLRAFQVKSFDLERRRIDTWNESR